MKCIGNMKKATTASDVLNAQCTQVQVENQQLKEQLQQAQAQLEETREQILLHESTSRALGSDSEMEQKLEQAETTCREAGAQAKKSETRSRRIEDWLQLAKKEVGKCLDAKDSLIQKLRRQLAQQQEVTRQNAKHIEELEEYVKI